MERKDDCDWVKGCTVLEVEGLKPRGRPKKTWMDVAKRDMKEMGLRWEDAQDRVESKTTETDCRQLTATLSAGAVL